MKIAVSAKSTLAIILIAAVGYFVAGRLGLLLAIPPGYATAVWPAAGVALATVLLLGYRACLGIMVGSFFVNLGTGVDTSSVAVLLKSLIVPITIGLGAAMQAAVGCILVHRFISSTLKLDSIREVSRFIFLVAAGSSLVNATIGTGTLLLAGIMAPDNYLFNWATWWTGDAIGILIFTVLILTFFAPQVDAWRPRRLTIAVPLTLCFICVVFIFVLSSRWEVTQQRTSFERRAETIYLELEKAVRVPGNVLATFSSLFMASEHVTRDEFATFAEIPLRAHAGIQALEWIPHVTHADRDRYELLARQEGFRHFVFSEKHGGRLEAAKQRDEYFPVYYVSPMEGNENVLGYDLGSDASRRAAIDLAIRSKAVTSSESVQLVQAEASQRGVIMLMPVFLRGQADEIAGLVAVVFRIKDLVKSSISGDEIDGVVMTLTELNDAGESREILNSTEIWPDREGKEVEQFSWQKSLAIGNRQWQVSVVASQDFLSATRTLVPWAFLAGGLLFSGLLGAFLLYVTGETYRAKKTAQQLRESLSNLQEAQSQLVESEKLASLGGMMSGLAHELNTPVGIAVTAISTLGDQVKLINRKMSDNQLTREDLNQFLEIAAEAAKITEGNLNRASQLVKSFKEVAVDRTTDDIRKINLADYLEEILIYMRPSIKRTAHKVNLECPPDISITTVPGGLSQVIANLLNNSLMHAFDKDVTGHIRICAENVDSTIRLTYEDDGCGIPQESREKVFQPFYTTRKGSGGTGLGLHLVSNIVTQQLQGTITLVGDMEKGVRFEIVLPGELV